MDFSNINFYPRKCVFCERKWMADPHAGRPSHACPACEREHTAEEIWEAMRENAGPDDD